MSNQPEVRVPEPSGFDIVAAILGVEADIVRLGVGYARVVYRKLIVALGVAIGIILCGFVLNVIAYYANPDYPAVAKLLYGINIVASAGFVIITAILWWRPNQVAWTGTAGAIIGMLDRDDPKHGGLSEGAKWLIEKYLDIFKIVTLVGAVALFYLGFIPFGENPVAFFVIVSGSIITGLLADRYKEQFKGTFAVELVFYGTCVIMALSFLSLIPIESWGGSGSFGQVLASNIKEGIFVFTLLLAIIVTLSMKGFRKWALILFGVMDLMFMPMNMLWGHLPSWPWPGTGSAQANIQPTAQVPPQVPQTRGVIRNVVATQGTFTEVRVPNGVKVTWYCQPGALMGVTHSKLPQGKFIDCADNTTFFHLGDDLQDLVLSFVSTDPSPKQAWVSW